MFMYVHFVSHSSTSQTATESKTAPLGQDTQYIWATVSRARGVIVNMVCNHSIDSPGSEMLRVAFLPRETEPAQPES